MSERKFFVYKITNLVNNKIYIGKTYDIHIRWESHKNAARRKNPNNYFIIHRSINKYASENFKIEVITEFLTESEAFLAEEEYIKFYNSKNREIGYNMTDGGDGLYSLKKHY